MSKKYVTDPALLAQLSAPEPAGKKYVTDPALLAQLEGDDDMKRMADPTAGMGRGEKFLVGAGAATDRTIRGITGLVEGVLPEEFANANKRGAEDAEVYKQHHPGGWATAGEIAGDIAMSAAPVAKGAQVLTKAAQAAKMGRFAPAAANVASNAGYAAATAPEDRGMAALTGGAATAGGQVLTRALRGAKPGAGAQHLLDSGVPVTFGQVVGETGGKLAKGFRHLEEGAEALPIVGSLIGKNRAAQQEAFRDVMAPEARALPLSLDFTPKEMIKMSGRVGEPVPHLARVAEKVMGSRSTEPTLRQTMGGGAMLGTMGVLAYKPAITTALIAAGYSLPKVQQALTGQTTTQKLIEDVVARNPKLAGLSNQALLQLLRSISTNSSPAATEE